jgi:class 3 adenylate cyclase
MKKLLYNNHIKKISDVINTSKTFSNFDGLHGIGDLYNESSDKSKSEKGIVKPAIAPLTLETDMSDLARLMGINQINKPRTGDHPYFKHLREKSQIEKHYITSLFIDLKRSTQLFKKYKQEDVLLIIQTIQSAAINTCALFGGHIQRLQYDGVFAYFGGRTIKKSDSTYSAICASTFFNYFVKYELKQIFEQEGIEDIYTRIGIDFGDDQDVIWAIIGCGDCTELTTSSLHTSLAPKMQANAKSNGVVIGENVKELLPDDLKTLCDFVKDDNNRIQYIFEHPEKNFYYKQSHFDWIKFLKKLPFVKIDEKGNLFIDYDYDPIKEQKELERAEKIRQQLKSSQNGNSYLDSGLNITTQKTPVPIKSHNFYYDSSKDTI